MHTSALLLAILLAPPTPVQQEAHQAELIWGDLDRDGLDEALVLGPRGQVLLLGNRGEGRFEDVTARSGLELAEFATCALIADFDGDGLKDLFLGSGDHRLWRNLGEGAFQPVSSGVEHDLIDLEALALDHDRDGKLDLHLHTEAGDVFYRNVGQGRFERIELPGADHPVSFDVAASDSEDYARFHSSDSADFSPARRRYRRWLRDRAANTGRASGSNGSSVALAGGPVMSATNIGSLPLTGLPSMICAGTIVDQATTQCIEASSVPTLGELYPLSSAFNLSSANNFVGINTTAPAHRVHIVESTATGLFSQGGTTGVRGDANLVGTGNRFGGEFTASGGSNNIGVRGSSTIGVHGIGTAYGAFGETNSALSTGVFGRANHTSAVTTGVLGEVASTSGTAILGQATATTGITYGVRGTNNSSTGAGVRGEGPVTGVRGDANKSGGSGDRFGGHFSASGGSNNVGVFSVSTTGVQGVGTTYGVRGSASAIGGVGVTGDATATSASGTIGVSGTSASMDGVGVRGEVVNSGASGSAYGVEGIAPVRAIYGRATNTTSSSATGVTGITSSSNGTGVLGSYSGSAGAYGVRGVGRTGVAGQHVGSAGAEPGIHGESASNDANAVGVLGILTAPSVYGNPVGAQAAGVKGVNTDSSLGGYGVWGDHAGSGIGVYGHSTDGSGIYGASTGGNGVTGVSQDNSGVFGSSSSSSGVFGSSSSSSGVYGSSSSGIGVYGFSSNGTAISGLGASEGIVGRVLGITGDQRVGDFAFNTNHPGASGTKYGVYSNVTSTGAAFAHVYGVYAHAFATTPSVTSYAGYFSGKAHVTGTLSAGSKAFRIDHPLDPENKYLQHSCVESSDMKNLYDGVVSLDANGTAWVELPEWFEALNRDFRYQLTCIGPWAPVSIGRELEVSRFQIIGGKPGQRVSWQITGTRKDAAANAHRIQVEVEKPERERGFYLDAEAYGLPRERSVDYQLHERAAARSAQTAEGAQAPSAKDH